MIGRSSAGVRLFNVADDEHVVSAVRLDEQEEPENEAEEAIVEEMVGRGSDETAPEPTPDRDDARRGRRVIALRLDPHAA